MPSVHAISTAKHADPEDMIITKLGDPLPRCLPDGRVVKEPDVLRMVEKLDDNEVMEWLDRVRTSICRTLAVCRLLKNPDAG
jgi:hypothetical protein